MVSSEFTIVGDGWKRAGPDVVLSGLGWVSITGAGECLIKVLSHNHYYCIHCTHGVMTVLRVFVAVVASAAVAVASVKAVMLSAGYIFEAAKRAHAVLQHASLIMTLSYAVLHCVSVHTQQDAERVHYTLLLSTTLVYRSLRLRMCL